MKFRPADCFSLGSFILGGLVYLKVSKPWVATLFAIIGIAFFIVFIFLPAGSKDDGKRVSTRGSNSPVAVQTASTSGKNSPINQASTGGTVHDTKTESISSSGQSGGITARNVYQLSVSRVATMFLTILAGSGFLIGCMLFSGKDKMNTPQSASTKGDNSPAANQSANTSGQNSPINQASTGGTIIDTKGGEAIVSIGQRGGIAAAKVVIINNGDTESSPKVSAYCVVTNQPESGNFITKARFKVDTKYPIAELTVVVRGEHIQNVFPQPVDQPSIYGVNGRTTDGGFYAQFMNISGEVQVLVRSTQPDNYKFEYSFK